MITSVFGRNLRLLMFNDNLKRCLALWLQPWFFWRNTGLWTEATGTEN